MSSYRCSFSSACAASSALAWAAASAAWVSFLGLPTEGFLGGWGGLPPEPDEVEFDEEASLGGVEEEFEVSGEDWPDCVDGAPVEPEGGSVVPPGAVGLAVADDEVVASPGVAGAVVDESTCCDGLLGTAVLPAPARVFMRLGRYRPAANRTATTMKAPRAIYSPRWPPPLTGGGGACGDAE